MKKKQTRLICMLIAAFMLLSLAACGNKEPSDPNLIKIDDYTVLYKGATIMKDDEGNDAIVLTLDYTNNSKDDTAFWVAVYEKAMQGGVQLDIALVYPDPDSYVGITDDKFTAIAPGTTLEVHTAFVLRDATSPVEITFSDLFEKHKGTITLDPTVLTRDMPQSDTSAAETGKADGEKPSIPAEPTGDALLDWWNGEWYGWWIVTGGDGEYESWSNKWWDCCAVIDVGSDYTGTVEIWDETEPRGNGVSYATVSLSETGTGEHGTMMSEGGWFMWADLAHADWIVDPGIMDYDDLICIDGWYEDDDGSYHYAMYLRPWGTLWDDISADSPENLPAMYDSWYLPLVKDGKTMPDVIGGTEGSTDAGQSSPEPAETDSGSAGSNEEDDNDYGKSNANAEGIAPLEAMQELYKKCYENRNDAYHLFSYEDARDALGSDGVVWKKASYSWNETKHTYRWETADGKDYFNISFGLEGSDEWYFSCNMSDNVINGLW